MSNPSLEKNKGGRGKKASVQSVVIRVPVALRESVSWLDLGYRYSQIGGGYIDPLPSREAVEEKVQEIICRKVSARASLQLFVKWLYLEG